MNVTINKMSPPKQDIETTYNEFISWGGAKFTTPCRVCNLYQKNYPTLIRKLKAHLVATMSHVERSYCVSGVTIHRQYARNASKYEHII